MIVRIVKMTFREETIAGFLDNFEKHKMQIREFEGCEKLELLRDTKNPNIFFTHSYWQSETHLESYRHSDLFKGVWTFTKSLFADKPQAWSLTKEYSA